MTFLLWLHDLIYISKKRVNMFVTGKIYYPLVDRYTLTERCYLARIFEFEI
jgi:hypothetical protein